MSAYGIGSDTATIGGDGVSRVNTADSNVPATIVKWIPGEAITLYAGILGVGAAQGVLTGDETPQELLERIEAGSLGWFLVGVIVAAALVITGAFAAPRDPNVRISIVGLAVRVALALAAFALWTSALPGSWMYSLNFIRDMGAAYALLLVPAGLAFAAIAEWLTRRIRL